MIDDDRKYLDSMIYNAIDEDKNNLNDLKNSFFKTYDSIAQISNSIFEKFFQNVIKVHISIVKKWLDNWDKHYQLILSVFRKFTDCIDYVNYTNLSSDIDYDRFLFELCELNWSNKEIYHLFKQMQTCIKNLANIYKLNWDKENKVYLTISNEYSISLAPPSKLKELKKMIYEYEKEPDLDLKADKLITLTKKTENFWKFDKTKNIFNEEFIKNKRKIIHAAIRHGDSDNSNKNIREEYKNLPDSDKIQILDNILRYFIFLYSLEENKEFEFNNKK